MSDASLQLLLATQELIRQTEASLDYRPNLRRAMVAAHQAAYAVSEQLDAETVRLEFLATPTAFTGLQS